MVTYAVDFESFYSDDLSIKVLGPWAYVQRQDAESIYLVSIFGPDIDFVGKPADAPWDKIAGKQWVSHNAAFDRLVFDRLVELGVCLDVDRPFRWSCSANLSVFHGAPRDLKRASKALLGKEASKDYRKVVKGKLPKDLNPDELQQILDAGRQDATLAWELWEKYSPTWPEREQELSELTIIMGHRGVYIDVPRVERGIKWLKNLMWHAQNLIPWAGEIDDKGDEVALLSPKRLAQACREAGIPAPASVAKDSEECEAWLDQYGVEYPWVMALRTYRRCNALLKKLEAMHIRIMPNGRMGYGLKYFGGWLGRWSGDSGINLQNLPHGEMFGEEFFLGKKLKDGLRTPAEGAIFAALWSDGCEGVDLRACIIAPPGKKLAISDLASIEPRVTNWLAGNQEFLDLVASGVSPYEAYARQRMGWKGGELKKENPMLYKLSKAVVLSQFFGAGFLKFIKMVELVGAQEIFESPVSDTQIQSFVSWLTKVDNKEWLQRWADGDEKLRRTFVNSWLIVMDFRRNNEQAMELGKGLEQKFKQSIKDGKFEIVLPSGRKLTYRNISCAGGSWTAQNEIGGPRINYFSGKFVENCTQATARDVFCECKLKLWKEGYDIVLSVHDEVVIELGESENTDKIASIMREPVRWLPGCPIDVELTESKVYTK